MHNDRLGADHGCDSACDIFGYMGGYLLKETWDAPTSQNEENVIPLNKTTHFVIHYAAKKPIL